MIRNLKIFAVALAAVLSMAAVAASAASATADLTAGASSGKLTATQASENVFTITPGAVKCKTVHGETPFTSATITTGEASISYSNCSAFGFLSATITMNACTVHGEGGAEAKTLVGKIVCPVGQEITVSTFGCVVHIPSQTVAGHTVATGAGGTPADVTTTTTWEGMKYTETAGCPNVSATATTNNGTYTGQLTVKAFNTSGTQVSLVAD
jgi:hypothetical protein